MGSIFFHLFCASEYNTYPVLEGSKKEKRSDLTWHAGAKTMLVVPDLAHNPRFGILGLT